MKAPVPASSPAASPPPAGARKPGVAQAQVQPQPQGRRAEKKVANRQALMLSAQAVFTADGFEAASVRDISQRAGLALGTFYNYFTDKAAIFDAVIVEGFARLRESTLRERRAARDAAGFWRAAMAPVFTGLVGEAGFFRLLLRTESRVRERHHALFIEAPQARLVADIEAAVAAGWLTPPVAPSALLAAAVYGGLFEVCRRLLVEGRVDAARAEATLGFATRLLMEGAGSMGEAGLKDVGGDEANIIPALPPS